MATYQCEECGADFPKLSQLLQHRRSQNHWKKYACPSCKKVFNRKQNLDRHMKRHADDSNHHCPECLKVFDREDVLENHLHSQHGWGAPKRRATDEDGSGVSKKRRIINDLYTIANVSERHIEKFKTSAKYYKIKIADIDIQELPNILKTVKKIFQSIFDNIVENMPSTDLVRVTLDNPQLDFHIVLPFMRRSELTVDRILSEIERVLQSYEQFVLDETFGIELVHVQSISGSGYRKGFVDISKMVERKQSIIQIKNKDNLCCARALVTAIARFEKDPRWNSIRLGRDIQRELAVNLHERANVPLGECGIEEIKRFQDALSGYQIHILSKEHYNAIVFNGPRGGIPIYLYSHDNHYDVITSMTGFLNRSYFCQQCKKGYQHKERHICNEPCHYCRSLHDNKEEDWQYCASCNCKFVNKECFVHHLKKSDQGKSTCQIIYKCTQCGQMINRTKHKRQHVCGETYCQTCKDFYADGHQCYMHPVDDEYQQETSGHKSDKKQTRYIFFDFECTQDTYQECEKGYVPDKCRGCKNCNKTWCGSYEHVPNLCVVHKVCTKCINNDFTAPCECQYCGLKERFFSGPSTITSFCKWLFSGENNGTTVICHNFKGYDSYPILRYLHDNAILPEVITTGSKYMSITIPQCKIRFIDSINFIPMALAAMPDAFGEKELAKGYFPHLFNRRENETIVLDQLPDIKYYNPDGMKPNDRIKFLSWYEKHCHDHFDFKVELLRYCRSDVDILRKCCLKFRSLFLGLTKKEGSDGIDPFAKCITIASACNLVFRTLFLEFESIGIIPPHGYRPEERQSALAYQWLSYLAHEKNITIQHGRNKGEKQIGPYKLDGFYEHEGKQIALEFHGCFWHGCPKCYSKSTINPVVEMSMADLYTKTIEKQAYLESEGFTYLCIWECEFKQQLSENKVLKDFVDALEIESPLEPRDAFYGGRTEAFKLYEEASNTKTINYYDVTSLYPWVNKNGKIPMGHPDIITDHFKDLEHYEGLMKCKVLPPRGLHIPVLPSKCNGKLLFSLCRTCGETYQNSSCQHTVQERSFTGTWVTDELKMAVSQGYKILKMYEVWHFDNISQYDPITKTGGLFTEYVNTFLKVKQEASGWPDWCVNEQTKQKYIQDYYAKEGILLDSDKIIENPGLRSLAKLMLNSFWGKFGQRTNLAQTTFVTQPDQYFDMMTSDKQEIKNIRFVNDESVQVDWVRNDDFIPASSRTNVVIAAYTTAQARLKLYSYLKPLGNRLLYCDTDSIVFITSHGQWMPPLGDYLGDLTDEVPDKKAPDNTITQFVTGGPKNYAYNLLKPNKKGQTSICKVRGITLNFKNALDINFNTLHKMVTSREEVKPIKVVDNHKISRNAERCNVITKTETKDYRIVFDKRVITNDLNTLPYGI